MSRPVKKYKVPRKVAFATGTPFSFTADGPLIYWSQSKVIRKDQEGRIVTTGWKYSTDPVTVYLSGYGYVAGPRLKGMWSEWRKGLDEWYNGEIERLE